jgi:hypothetical protein
MFPALHYALGGELFNWFALGYLYNCPPHKYTLDKLADEFPQYLMETRPDASAPPDEREQWPEFIIELALLELAFLKTYDGPGVEGQMRPGQVKMLELDNVRLLDTRPMPTPCTRLFSFRYPVHSYLLSARADAKPIIPDPAESCVVLTRQNYRVVLHEVPRVELELLRLLDGQRSLRHALEHGFGPDYEKLQRISTIRKWLRDWLRKGFVALAN